MEVPLRYLTLLVVLADFVLIGAVLPPLVILSVGSLRAGPGRYRGALASAIRLLPALTFLVRAKAAYGVILAALVGFARVELPWWAVGPIVVLVVGWELVLELTGAVSHYLTDRSKGIPPRVIREEGPPGNPKTGPHPRAKRMLLIGVAALVGEMVLLTYVVTRLFFIAL
jgi:hypothetical protein